MRQTLQSLYQGNSRKARLFRYGMLGFDIVTILFFIVSPPMGDRSWIYIVDASIVLAISFDLGIRYWLDERKLRFLKELKNCFEVASASCSCCGLFERCDCCVPSSFSKTCGWSLAFSRNGETIQSAIGLGVFVFVVTAPVYVLQIQNNSKIDNYQDRQLYRRALLYRYSADDRSFRRRYIINRYGRAIAAGSRHGAWGGFVLAAYANDFPPGARCL